MIAVDSDADLIGANIDGRFSVKGRLGQGAMGVVYRAVQLSIGREVAIKVLDRRIERDVGAVKRFLREAKIASALAHPNTVPIIDFGQNQDGRLYLVMELVRGRTLHEEISRCAALPVPRILTMGIQLCDALAMAHGMSIVHRDLKLDNVMLLETSGDHIKILDFGLSRSVTDTSMNVTAAGMIAGTPRYMPPELMFDSAAPAPAQDMYAVGVMLGELAIGKALWTAPTIEALFKKKLEDTATLVAVPDALRSIVKSLLAEDPAARPTAVELGAMLRSLGPTNAVTLQVDAMIAAPTATDPFAALSARSLVALDERAGAPERAAAAVPVATVAPVARAPLEDAVFAGPAASDAAPLDLEPAELARRAANQRAVVPDPIRKQPSIIAGVLVALLLISLVGVGAYVLYNYKSRDAARTLDGPGVSVRITAVGPHEVSIDGKRVGTTPLSLHLPKGTKPVLITAPGVPPTQVVPDRDQTVHLARP